MVAYETNLGTVTMHYFFEQINTTATIPVLSTYTIPTYTFKIIAVSGAVGTRMVQGEVNHHDYNAVSRFTGAWIQDKQATNREN